MEKFVENGKIKECGENRKFSKSGIFAKNLGKHEIHEKQDAWKFRGKRGSQENRTCDKIGPHS